MSPIHWGCSCKAPVAAAPYSYITTYICIYIYSCSCAHVEPLHPSPALLQASGFVAEEEVLLFPMASVSYPVSQSPPIPLNMTYLSSTSFSDSRLTLLLTVEQHRSQLFMQLCKDSKPCSAVSWPLAILRNKNLKIWGLWNVLECKIGVLCRSTVYIYLV